VGEGEDEKGEALGWIRRAREDVQLGYVWLCLS